MQKSNACVITPRAAGKGQYHWTWQAVEGQRASRCHFRYFYDCVTDARSNGFEVDIDEVVRRLKADRVQRSAESQPASELRAA